jgi:RNA binding exosome subunit
MNIQEAKTDLQIRRARVMEELNAIIAEMQQLETRRQELLQARLRLDGEAEAYARLSQQTGQQS